jgi:ADP-ribose pyrophosphatase
VVDVLGEGRYLRLVRDAGWEWVDRVNVSGIVVVVAVTEHRELVLVEQHRRPVGARVVELPAGLAGDLGPEELPAAAARELEEETGFTAERLEPICAMVPSAGLGSEVVTFFRAHGLRRTGAGGGDATEDIEVHLVPLRDLELWVRGRIARGALVDPMVFAGAYLADAEARA